MITIHYTAGTDRHEFTVPAIKASIVFKMLENMDYRVTLWHRERPKRRPVVAAIYSRINGEIKARRFAGLLGVQP
jgi:hypothetical protein